MRLAGFALLLMMLSSCGAARETGLVFGDPFRLKAGAVVELPDGVALSLLAVRDERCPVARDVYCVWQGEAFIDIELHVSGRKVQGSMSTEKRDRTLLGYRVELVGLFPAHILEPPPAASDYMALVRVAPIASEGAASFRAFASPDEALRAAERHVSVYADVAKQICREWKSAGRVLYLENSWDLCEMAARVTPSAYAHSAYGDVRRIYFPIDNPELMAQIGERLYWSVEMPSAPKDVLDQFRRQDASPLDCTAQVLRGNGPAPC